MASKWLAFCIIIGSCVICLESATRESSAGALASVRDCSIWKLTQEETGLRATCLRSTECEAGTRSVSSMELEPLLGSLLNDKPGAVAGSGHADCARQTQQEGEEVQAIKKVVLFWIVQDGKPNKGESSAKASKTLERDLVGMCRRLGLGSCDYGHASRGAYVVGVSAGKLPDTVVSWDMETLPGSLPGSSVLMASRAGKTNLAVRVCTAHRSANLEVRVASDGEDADGWVQEIVERRWKSGESGAGVPPLGVDMEWKPTFSKGQPQNKVALVQVACGNKVLLAQIGLMKPGGLPPLLAALMSDPKVRKVGVGLDGDAVKLKTDWNQELTGRVDLAKFAESTPNWCGTGRSLATVTQSALGIKLCKAKKIRMSNWGVKELSGQQAVYAALDAWVASEALTHLEKSSGMTARSESSVVKTKKGSEISRDCKHYVVQHQGKASIYSDFDYAAGKVASLNGSSVQVFHSQEAAELFVRRVNLGVKQEDKAVDQIDSNERDGPVEVVHGQVEASASALSSKSPGRKKPTAKEKKKNKTKKKKNQAEFEELALQKDEKKVASASEQVTRAVGASNCPKKKAAAAAAASAPCEGPKKEAAAAPGRPRRAPRAARGALSPASSSPSTKSMSPG